MPRKSKRPKLESTTTGKKNEWKTFPLKLWEVVNKKNDAIFWGSRGDTVVFENFALASFLHKQQSVFGVEGMEGFLRQLIAFGFKFVSETRRPEISQHCFLYEFGNDFFIRDDPALLLCIQNPKKRKADQLTSNQTQSTLEKTVEPGKENTSGKLNDSHEIEEIQETMKMVPEKIRRVECRENSSVAESVCGGKNSNICSGNMGAQGFIQSKADIIHEEISPKLDVTMTPEKMRITECHESGCVAESICGGKNSNICSENMEGGNARGFIQSNADVTHGKNSQKVDITTQMCQKNCRNDTLVSKDSDLGMSKSETKLKSARKDSGGKENETVRDENQVPRKLALEKIKRTECREMSCVVENICRENNSNICSENMEGRNAQGFIQSNAAVTHEKKFPKFDITTLICQKNCRNDTVVSKDPNLGKSKSETKLKSARKDSGGKQNRTVRDETHFKENRNVGTKIQHSADKKLKGAADLRRSHRCSGKILREKNSQGAGLLKESGLKETSTETDVCNGLKTKVAEKKEIFRASGNSKKFDVTGDKNLEKTVSVGQDILLIATEERLSEDGKSKRMCLEQNTGESKEMCLGNIKYMPIGSCSLGPEISVQNPRKGTMVKNARFISAKELFCKSGTGVRTDGDISISFSKHKTVLIMKPNASSSTARDQTLHVYSQPTLNLDSHSSKSRQNCKRGRRLSPHDASRSGIKNRSHVPLKGGGNAEARSAHLKDLAKDEKSQRPSMFADKEPPDAVQKQGCGKKSSAQDSTQPGELCLPWFDQPLKLDAASYNLPRKSQHVPLNASSESHVGNNCVLCAESNNNSVPDRSKSLEILTKKILQGLKGNDGVRKQPVLPNVHEFSQESSDQPSFIRDGFYSRLKENPIEENCVKPDCDLSCEICLSSLPLDLSRRRAILKLPSMPGFVTAETMLSLGKSLEEEEYTDFTG